jgi:hypothetical protein
MYVGATQVKEPEATFPCVTYASLRKYVCMYPDGQYGKKQFKGWIINAK